MLFAALALSIILLVAANVVVQRTERPLLWVLVAGLAVTIVPQFLLFFFPPVMLLAALLVGAVAVWIYYFDREPRAYLPLSLAAAAIAFTVCGLRAGYTVLSLRSEFPYVSMDERLPKRAPKEAPELSTTSAERLAVMERDVEHRGGGRPEERQRLEELAQLREHPVKVFRSRPAFGVSWLSQLSESTLRDGLREDPPKAQPGRRVPLSWSAATLQRPLDDAERHCASLANMHRDVVVDFVNPPGFGYFHDRGHVAGFQEHRLSKIPDAPDPWVLQTVELVGLVRPEKPAVYVSDRLPRMDLLRQAETRGLDEFEVLGLNALQEGEDLFVRQAIDGRRALGAIRNGRQCQSCHEDNRGQLLGAFSYTFVRPPH